MTLLSVFQTRKLRPVRASLFLALGGWGVVPAVHAFVLHSQEPHMRQSLLHTLGMGLVYVVRFLTQHELRACMRSEPCQLCRVATGLARQAAGAAQVLVWCALRGQALRQQPA